MGEEEGGGYDCVATTRLDTVSSRPAFLKVQGRYTVKKGYRFSRPPGWTLSLAVQHSSRFRVGTL
jgi:hypothetical protein